MGQDAAERALPRLDDAARLAKQAGDAELEAEIEVQRCWVLAVGQPAQARSHLEQLLPRLTEAGRGVLAGKARLCGGYALERLHQHKEAVAIYESVVAEAQRLRSARLEADARTLRGEARYERGDYGNALADLSRAYDIYLAQNNEPRQRYLLNAIANLYADANIGEFDRAIEYYERLARANEKPGRERELSTTLYNLGSTLERKGALEASLTHYRRAAELDRARGDVLEAAYSDRSIGIVLTKLGRGTEALPIFERALRIFAEGKDPDRTAMTRLSRAITLRTLGRPREALPDLNHALAHFKADGNERFLERIHDERAQVLAALGDLAGAVEERNQQVRIMRALTDRAKSDQTARMRVLFDTQRKEEENRALLVENAARSQALADAARIRLLQSWIIALAAFLLLGAAAFAWQQGRTAGRMRDLAMTDELTRLANRRQLFALADVETRAARAGGLALAVLGFDIDHFKRVNDTYGHDVGDVVLSRVAQAARSALRTSDRLGRTGGEEFIALLPRTDLATALEVAERVRQTVAAVDFEDVAPGLKATVSIGAAQLPANEAELGATLKRADEALYAAKQGGRNRVVAAQ